MQLAEYIPVLILLGVGILFAAATLVASLVVGRIGTRNRVTTRSPVKNIAYECGMLPEGEGSSRMSVKFYLVAMLFILFDIEVIFLYPWAVVYKEMLASHGAIIFFSMLSFLGILLVGYVYAVKKEAFDWKR